MPFEYDPSDERDESSQAQAWYRSHPYGDETPETTLRNLAKYNTAAGNAALEVFKAQVASGQVASVANGLAGPEAVAIPITGLIERVTNNHWWKVAAVVVTILGAFHLARRLPAR